MKRDAYDRIADQIIAQLEQGEIPWRKPWTLPAGLYPQNATGRPYHGINALLLGLAPYADPRWLTFNNCKAADGKVRKGEKGQPVVFFKPLDRACDPAHPGEVCNRCSPTHPGVNRFWFLRYYTVFNVEQCEGLDLTPLEAPESKVTPLEAAEAIVAGYSSPPTITHNGVDRAYYSPLADSIHLPRREAFHGAPEYYSTLFHELTHSTGHASRLDRHGLETGIAPFGSETYSREELAAEFGAAFLNHQAGIDSEIDNSAAYIANWAKVIRKDKRLVVTAASQGQKAADYILGD